MPTIGPLKIKIQIICGAEYALGPGKAEVLEAILREGSISGAGRALGMSYRRAWMLVDAMNRCWTEPLVETTAGGGQAKGARLTALGREVLAAYRTLEGQLSSAAEGRTLDVLSTKLLPVPRPGPASREPHGNP